MEVPSDHPRGIEERGRMRRFASGGLCLVRVLGMRVGNHTAAGQLPQQPSQSPVFLSRRAIFSRDECHGT